MRSHYLRKYFIGGFVVALAIAALLYNGLQGAFHYYYTVAEVKVLGEENAGKQLRVSGIVVPGSVEWGNDGSTLRFSLEEGGEKLIVIFRGTVPDTFKPGNEAVVEGTYDPRTNIFRATRVLAKCPSKYVLAK
jgi:cytochrome c-type biogenesis protein CcmE